MFNVHLSHDRHCREHLNVILLYVTMSLDLLQNNCIHARTGTAEQLKKHFF